MSAHAAKQIDRRIVAEPKARKRINNYNWTEESVKYATDRVKEGVSAANVAKEMEKLWPQFGKPTRNAVIGKVCRTLAKVNQKVGNRFVVIEGQVKPISQRIQKINNATANELNRSAPTPVNMEALPVSDIQTLLDPTREAARKLGPVVHYKTGKLIGSVVDLSVGLCHYPIGDPQKPGFAFCGRTVTHSPYCDAHRLLVYDPREDQRRNTELKKLARQLPTHLRS